MLDAVPAVAASAFWRAQGLRTMTANALAYHGICSFKDLTACEPKTLERMYSIGKRGLLDIQAMLLQRAANNPAETLPLAGYSDDALVMELLNRGYRIDRPNLNA